MATVKKKKTTAKAKPRAKKPAVKKANAKTSAPKKAMPKKATPKSLARPKGIPEQLLGAALKVLDDRQAQEIVSIPLAGRSSLADYMIIASGKTNRQVAALAEHLNEAFTKAGAGRVIVEGKENANWVLVDAGDVIVHLFQPDVRRYYDLDALWNKKASKR